MTANCSDTRTPMYNDTGVGGCRDQIHYASNLQVILVISYTYIVVIINYDDITIAKNFDPINYFVSWVTSGSNTVVANNNNYSM